MSRHRTRRRVSLWGVTALVLVIALLASSAWLYFQSPIPPSAAPTMPLKSSEFSPSETPTDWELKSSNRPSASPTPARTCEVGTPVRFVWPDMGVDTTIEQIGVDYDEPKDSDGNYPLGNPKDKDKIGWFKYGPKPGENNGNVIIDGHTYRDGTAVFKPDFSSKVKVGSRYAIVVDNGAKCTYEVTEVFRAINKLEEYPAMVAKHKFYAMDGPEQSFGVTCSGSYNSERRTHEDVTAWFAKPVN